MEMPDLVGRFDLDLTLRDASCSATITKSGRRQL